MKYISVLCTLTLGFCACKSTPDVKTSDEAASSEAAASAESTSPWLSIAMSQTHACAVRDSELWCWSHLEEGDPVQGARMPALQAELVAEQVEMTTIRANGSHFCARSRRGQLECWQGVAYDKAEEISSTSRALALSSNLLCRVEEGERVVCGTWETGQYREDVSLERTFEEPIEDLQVGIGHACALLQSGRVSCWKQDTSLVALSPSVGSQEALEQVALMTVGHDYICTAKQQQGPLTCWGGVFSRDPDKSAPVSFDASHSLAIDKTFCYTDPRGQPLCKGTSEYDSIGARPVKASFFLPYLLTQDVDFSSDVPLSASVVAMREGKVCAVGRDQALRCYMPMWPGQVTQRGLPAHKVEGLASVSDVLTGKHTTLVLTEGGRLYLLGLGEVSSQSLYDGAYYSPRARSQRFLDARSSRENVELVDHDVLSIAMKASEQVLVRTGEGWHAYQGSGLVPLEVVDGSGQRSMPVGGAKLWAHPASQWICASGQELGEELHCFNAYNHHYAVQKLEGEPVELIPFGSFSQDACVRLESGSWQCLEPDSTGETRRRFVSAGDLDGVRGIYERDYNRKCRVMEGGALNCEITLTQPVTRTLSDVTHVSDGPSSLCAIDASQKVSCIGRNEYGTVSPVDRTIEEIPYYDDFEVVEMAPVVKVSTSETHTCAIDIHGELWCWGSNAFGESGALPTSIREVKVP